MKVPILDNHLHLDPAGAGASAISEFARAGGTHIILCHKPYKQAPIKRAADYEKAFGITLELAEKVRKETEVTVWVTLGPYPVELLHLAEKMPLAQAKEILLAGMDRAGEFGRAGAAIGLGVIGRPHFDVPPEILAASNEILLYGMELARELGCAAVLHTESGTPEVCRELACLADRAGLPRARVVKHYSPPLITEDANSGLFPSVLSSEKNIAKAAALGTRFLMETDYLDDPSRPGAVLGVKTVPKRTLKLLNEKILTEEDIFTIHQQNPKRVYGVEVEV